MSPATTGAPTFAVEFLDALHWTVGGGPAVVFFGPENVLGWNSTDFTNQAATGFDFTGTLSVTNGELLLVGMGLSRAPRGGASSDFSNTASIGVSLPGNASFTSDSGVFLTQSPVATPEPAMFVFAAIAMAVMGLVGWIRRRTGGEVRY